MGSLYRRGNTWWIKYYVNGLPKRESAETSKQKEAEHFLKQREGDGASGKPILPRADKVRYEEARDDLTAHYTSTGCRGLEEAGYRLKHLDAFYRGWRLASITGPAIARYIAHRQGEGAANGTANREVSVLVSMLRLAFEHNKLLRLPIVHKPKEAAPRAGFFEADQYEAVRRRLPDDLQTAAAIAYTFGWRTQSEVLTLTRAQVDLEAGVIRLDPGTTKNDDGRVVYMTPDLRRLVAAQVARVWELEREMGRIIPYLFPHFRKRLRGTQRRDTVMPGRTHVRRPGSGRIRHDSGGRRCGTLVNAGVPERVAMTITGHKAAPSSIAITSCPPRTSRTRPRSSRAQMRAQTARRSRLRPACPDATARIYRRAPATYRPRWPWTPASR